MLNLDQSTEFGARVERRLHEEQIIWLTTVRSDGTPQPSPVWFLWQADGTMLIYSRPDTPKLRNIVASPRVALNFDGNGMGGDIIVFSGTAAIDKDAPPANQIDVYIDKYRDGITRIGMEPDSFATTYSVALRVTPSRVRGH